MPNRTINETPMREEIIGTVGAAALKASPPAAVAGAVVAGASLDRAILWLTAIYLVGQIAYLAWRWIREWRQKASA